MSRQRLLEEWNRYVASVFTSGRPGPIQLEETRRAFYAGAHALFSRILGDLTASSQPEPADMEMMDDFEAELKEFKKKVETGAA